MLIDADALDTSAWRGKRIGSRVKDREESGQRLIG